MTERESLRAFRERLPQLDRLVTHYKAETWSIASVLTYDRTLIEALGIACEAALAHAEGLRMDTPEDQAVVDKLADTLRIALGLRGVSGDE